MAPRDSGTIRKQANAMEHATSEHTTTRQSERTLQQDTSAGPNAISIAPPAYGIDFVDRDLVDAGSLSVNPPSLIQAKPMTAPPGEGRGTPRGYKKNKTGLPDRLKAGVETLSGLAMDDVKVHYNADKPVQLQAYAYVQGKDIQLKRMEGEEIQSIHAAAAAGVQGTGHPLPHFDKIQKSFGQHDVSGVQAFSDAKAKNASRDIGAKAYTTGHKIAFSSVSPDLHTTAHEATLWLLLPALAVPERCSWGVSWNRQ